MGMRVWGIGGGGQKSMTTSCFIECACGQDVMWNTQPLFQQFRSMACVRQVGNAYLHDNGRDVDGHERVGRHQHVKQPGDLGQLLEVMGEPGYEPAECKEGGDATLLDMCPQLCVSLHDQK